MFEDQIGLVCIKKATNISPHPAKPKSQRFCKNSKLCSESHPGWQLVDFWYLFLQQAVTQITQLHSDFDLSQIIGITCQVATPFYFWRQNFFFVLTFIQQPPYNAHTSSTYCSAHIMCWLLHTHHALDDVWMHHAAGEPRCLHCKANYDASKAHYPTTTCMQHASRCNYFPFVSLVHNSAPFIAAQFLHSLATATALFPRLSEPLIQLDPVPTFPNMHAHVINSDGQSQGDLCYHCMMQNACTTQHKGLRI